jgi:hypothetical protein
MPTMVTDAILPPMTPEQHREAAHWWARRWIERATPAEIDAMRDLLSEPKP